MKIPDEEHSLPFIAIIDINYTIKKLHRNYFYLFLVETMTTSSLYFSRFSV